MSGPSDWRASLTALERYNNIQRITADVAASLVKITKTPFQIESEAYNTATTREEYNAACTLVNDGTPPSSEDEPTPPHEQPEKSGIDIGPYPDCHYIASGATCDVYHSRPRHRALKVITARQREPHNPIREAKILGLLQKPCIPLLETFYDRADRFILVFPYMPLTLGTVIGRGTRLPDYLIRRVFIDVFTALKHLHSQGMIHRDIKPAAVLLAGNAGPAYLADFGITWHPTLCAATEPADNKILDVGSSVYRAPEILFGNKSYGPPVDMWAAGVMLAECCRRPLPRLLFKCRPIHEDGNQLSLILSIFKTIGSPTRETWPEAQNFRTPPFDMYKTFETRPWEEILPDVDPEWRKVVAACLTYNSSRLNAEQALQIDCLRDK